MVLGDAVRRRRPQAVSHEEFCSPCPLSANGVAASVTARRLRSCPRPDDRGKCPNLGSGRGQRHLPDVSGADSKDPGRRPGVTAPSPCGRRSCLGAFREGQRSPCPSRSTPRVALLAPGMLPDNEGPAGGTRGRAGSERHGHPRTPPAAGRGGRGAGGETVQKRRRAGGRRGIGERRSGEGRRLDVCGNVSKLRPRNFGQQRRGSFFDGCMLRVVGLQAISRPLQCTESDGAPGLCESVRGGCCAVGKDRRAGLVHDGGAGGDRAGPPAPAASSSQSARRSEPRRRKPTSGRGRRFTARVRRRPARTRVVPRSAKPARLG